MRLIITIVSLFQLQLICHGQLFDMKCTFTEANMEYYNQWICNTVDLNIDGLGQVLDSVNGEKTVLEDVVGLTIYNQVVHYLPYFLDVYFPKILVLEIVASKLKLLTKYDLEVYPNLKSLILVDNELQYLDADLFELCTKIRYFTLLDSQLFVINGPIFAPLSLVTWIVISLPCMEKECFSHDCIADTVRDFKRNCEYDSIYPGFQEYFKFLMNTVDECEFQKNDVKNVVYERRHNHKNSTKVRQSAV